MCTHTHTCTYALQSMSYRVGRELRGNFRVDFNRRSREIRRLPGSDRFALLEVRAVAVLVESTRSSLAGQIGVDGAAYGHKRNEEANSTRERRISLFPLEIAILLSASFFFITFTQLLLLPFFYRKTSSRLDTMRDTNTRKEISLALYKLRPRSPKFCKKGSGNNKTGRTSCTLFHARKKTDLRKKGVNDGPAKGDTFHFMGVQGIPFLSIRFLILSCLCRKNREDPESRVACHGTRTAGSATRFRRFTYVCCDDHRCVSIDVGKKS